MPIRIDDRLIGQLRTLVDYRLVTLSQFTYLHFKSKRTARRRLQELSENGYAEPIAATLRPRKGRNEGVFGIGSRGIDLLASRNVLPNGLESEQLSGRSVSRQTEHHLLLNWFRVSLVQKIGLMPDLDIQFMASESPFSAEWVSGRNLLRTSTGLNEDNEEVFIEPDAAINLRSESSQRSVLFFLEVDMGTEPKTSGREGIGFRDKIVRYKSMFRSMDYKCYEDVWGCELNGFRVLVLTDSAERMKSLCELTQSASPSGFIWLTSRNRLVEQGAYDRIWHPGGKTEPESILDGRAISAPLDKLPD